MLRILLLLVLCTIMVKTVPSSVPRGPAKNCKELLDQGSNITGIYAIKPDPSEKPFLVYCDMKLKDGGWLYFLNRIDGSEDFSVPWSDYKNGFGNLAREFWLGLDHLYQLTGEEVNELLVELVDWNLKKYHIHYKTFSIASEAQNYRLQVLGGHSGDLGDSLLYHGGLMFSTIDRDNDKYTSSCSKNYGGGGWWYKSCHTSHLTGVYYSSVKDDPHGICWTAYTKINPNYPYYDFKEARMMIRPHRY